MNNKAFDENFTLVVARIVHLLVFSKKYSFNRQHSHNMRPDENCACVARSNPEIRLRLAASPPHFLLSKIRHELQWIIERYYS